MHPKPDLASIHFDSGRMPAIIARYSSDRAALRRKYPHETSPMCAERMAAFYEDWLAALRDLDFESLNQDDRIDYITFSNHLEFSARKLQIKVDSANEVGPLLPFAQTIYDLLEARIRMEWAEAEPSAYALETVRKEAVAAHDSLQANLADYKTRWKRPAAGRAARSCGALREGLRIWFEFYNGFDPGFSWWAQTPYTNAAQALADYEKLLRTSLACEADAQHDKAEDIIGDPIGRDALLEALRFEMIPYSPEELIEIATTELNWCEAELREASQELGYGKDTVAALEYVKTQHAPAGGQHRLVRDLALEAIEYLDQHNLLTVPDLARETWRLDMMSAEKQKVNPFFLGGEMIQVSFPTNTMSHEEKMMSMRGNNRHFSRATVQHELIPGHHLQFFMLDRYRNYRHPFHTPFWIEGWTIYWELLLYKLGFPGTPENRIGMLFWRIHRCVRIIFSLSFHLEKMSPQECVEMLVDRVGHERNNAVAEVRRSCSDAYPPLYQCAYMIGGLQVWALRREMVDSGKMTDRQFHDAFIQQNCIPVSMIRASLSGETITRDWRPSWRFYNGPAGA